MLKIVIPISPESWDEGKEEFVEAKFKILQLEHSLVSISKWEMKYHKPFIDTLEKGIMSSEETKYYIECMTLTPNIDPEVYNHLTNKNMEAISKYIRDPMTATTISGLNEKGKKEVLTNELIYYYMLMSGIPMECQKWHLNRLITLIQVFSVKNGKPKKMSPSEVAAYNRNLNAARRKQFNTKG